FDQIKNYKRYICYLILRYTFGVSFHVQFSNNDGGVVDSNPQNDTTGNPFDSFSSLSESFVKALVMMIGEFNAQDIPFYRHQLSYLTFLFFLFLVTLVIMNLANGLAVSDVTALSSCTKVHFSVRSI
ncbi:transient receptor potential cation channel protein painless-like, partial [Culex pipiens pallens]|uniref:transient receptor potential cation channel protein painless-like n=1 Tax=Culex pipiens pallens TaxID=42434 RepID=UPI0022AAED7A